MPQLTYGTKNQISFSCDCDFYKALGYLARNCNATSLHWEKNDEQGAWGQEGRVHFYVDAPKIPGIFLLTAGVGNVRHRTNCNDFVEEIVANYGFQYGIQQDQQLIRTKIPQVYQKDFDDGLNIID